VELVLLSFLSHVLSTFKAWQSSVVIGSLWNKQELPEQCNESRDVPAYKKDDKAGYNNCRNTSLLSTSFKILSNILVAKLNPNIDEIARDHRCKFRHKNEVQHSSNIGEKYECRGTVRDFKKASGSDRYQLNCFMFMYVNVSH
jgi:hypothetical protein